jgi:tRNA wybutosine-synthesizing protein 3
MSQDAFDQKKRLIVQELAETLSAVPDASPKGSIDELCVPIIHLINSHSDMVTTSSCSGRVSVFLEGEKQIGEHEYKIGGKGDGGRWLFVTHDSGNLDNWYKGIDFHYVQAQPDTSNENTRYILFKFEPLILHVKCRDLKQAQKLYQVAMNCGFRETGIGINNLVAIRISIKLDIPIGYLNVESQDVFVTEEYLNLVTKLSLERFKENEKKLKQLYDAIEVLNTTVEQHIETKEERRDRKRREGLERQQKQQEEKSSV